MAKIKTDAFTNKKPVPQPDSAAIKWVPIDVVFPSAALAVGDLIELVELPIGVGLLDYTIAFPDIDTGVAAFAFSIGSENAGGTDLGTVYESGLTAGQTDTVVRCGKAAAAQEVTTAARKIAIKVTAAAATYAGSGKTGQVLLALRG